jgi:dTDP-4-dehydrorhamnose reductase
LLERGHWLSAPVIVAGGNGQVATALKHLSSDLSYEFLDRSELDICCSRSVFECFAAKKPCLVINAAAFTAVDDAENDPRGSWQVNHLGPETLAIACAERQIPLIHLSTDYVFDGTSNVPYSETEKACPVGTYGRTKFAGEEGVRAKLDEHVVVRLSGIFSGHGSCFPRSILKAALRYEQLKIVNDQITGPTSAYSIAVILDSISQIALNGKLSWGTYHFAQQPFLTWFEFAQIIIEKAENLDSRFRDSKLSPINTEEYGALAPRPKYSCLDSSKLLKELELDASILDREADLDDAIRSILPTL